MSEHDILNRYLEIIIELQKDKCICLSSSDIYCLRKGASILNNKEND